MKLNKNHIVWHSLPKGMQVINVRERYMDFNTLQRDGSYRPNTYHVSYSHVIYFNESDIVIWNKCSTECFKALVKEIV